MDKIDVIFYINLEHRTDRRVHIEAEITKLCSDVSKIVRINAVKHSIGVVGCVMSHILALEEFAKHPEWNTCMVIEDDFTCFNPSQEHNNERLKHFFSSFHEWDLLSLSYNPSRFSSSPTDVEGIVNIIKTQTTSGYIVRRKFVDTLLSNFKEGLELKLKFPAKDEYCLDIHWNRLNSVAKWYALVPALGYQCAGYSDIERKHVNYRC